MNQSAAGKSSHFKSLQNYVIIWQEEEKSRLAEVPFLLDSKIFPLKKSNRTLEVFEIYSPEIRLNSMPNLVRKVCETLTTSHDAECDPMSGIWERRRDLNSVHLRALIEPMKPFGSLDKDSRLDGIFPRIFLEIQKHLNFSYEIVRSKDGTWGSKKVRKKKSDENWTVFCQTHASDLSDSWIQKAKAFF